MSGPQRRGWGEREGRFVGRHSEPPPNSETPPFWEGQRGHAGSGTGSLGDTGWGVAGRQRPGARARESLVLRGGCGCLQRNGLNGRVEPEVGAAPTVRRGAGQVGVCAVREGGIACVCGAGIKPASWGHAHTDPGLGLHLQPRPACRALHLQLPSCPEMRALLEASFYKCHMTIKGAVGAYAGRSGG